MDIFSEKPVTKDKLIKILNLFKKSDDNEIVLESPLEMKNLNMINEKYLT